MLTLDLSGEWTASEKGRAETFPAHVPGCIHLDLIRAGRIPDPYDSDNERQLQHLQEKDWVFRRSFEVPTEALGRDRLELVFEGLDTIATVRVNGRVVAKTDNMFRTYRFEVGALLRSGKNGIEVEFASAARYTRRRQRAEPLNAWNDSPSDPLGPPWLRKEQCNFGWDWGPRLVTAGIWRAARIEAWDGPRLDGLSIRQEHGARDVEVCVRARIDGDASGHRLAVRLFDPEGALADEAVAEADAPAELAVRRPRLWYPNGLGDQPLYRLEAQLLDGTGAPLSRVEKRIGLRRLELIREPEGSGETFHFAANGRPFFAKGANWIPADTFAPRVTREDYRRLIADAAAAHMNMLRVWGGGLYEDDAFYDLCDEMGICVWQDFMFACAMYPTHEPGFLENVRVEAEQNVRRIHHHACLALLCGNNELEQGLVGPEWTPETMSWEEYGKLFDELLAKVSAEQAPDVPYWPGSPHTPVGDRADFNNPDAGDAHLWSVWHARQPFEWYRTCNHRFCSEFGFQSLPHPETVALYARPGERNITSYVMEHHQRSPVGNGLMIAYMLDWFRLPAGFESTVWLTQILQGLAIKYAVEHWRRNMPRTMGTIYWQLNDCWPVASWSSIDHPGRWKALHYMARRFFAPVLVSLVEDAEKGTVEVHLSNDRPSRFESEVRWWATDAGGRLLAEASKEVRVAQGRSQRVLTAKLADVISQRGRREVLVFAEVHEGDALVSANSATFERPKHIDWPEPGLATSVTGGRGVVYTVTVRSKRPAPYTWLEVEGIRGVFSDNFMDLPAGAKRTIRFEARQDTTLDDVRMRLRARSLVDTYRE